MTDPGLRAELEAFFETCVRETLDTPDLMAQYRRLTGSTLGLDRRSPIDKMVDRATGHDPHSTEWTPFFGFVRDYVWRPVLCVLLSNPDRK